MSFLRAAKSFVGSFLRVVKHTSVVQVQIHPSFVRQVRSVVPQNRRIIFLWSNLRGFCYQNAAAEIRRKACSDFIRRNITNFSLVSCVGLFIAENNNASDAPSLSALFRIFQSSFDLSLQEDKGSETKHTYPTKITEYDVGERLGKPSSNAAVYSAQWNGKQCALKMMFNYRVPSCSAALYQAFEKEYYVLSSSETEHTNEIALKKHPNIIKLLQTFVDRTPLIYDSIDSYPQALPRQHYEDGVGRNRTLFLVMPQYTCSLREYLKRNRNTLTFKQRLHLLCQLLEAVAHLERHNVAHRDLKSDNILLEVSEDEHYPQLVVTDFGCCLAESDNMLMPFETYLTDRGGNAALMAPEIINAVPRKNLCLDYSKADVWSAGTIAYEIFNNENPFYNQLENTKYNEHDLPSLRLGDNVVNAIIRNILCKEPDLRLSAEKAATMVFLMLHAPREWFESCEMVHTTSINSWLLALSIVTMRQCLQHGVQESYPADIQLRLVFLSRISLNEMTGVLSAMRDMQGT